VPQAEPAVAATAETLDISALVAEYERSRDRRTSCRVCDNPYREAIDEMLRRGGAPSVSRFLQRRLGIAIGHATLSRHKNVHIDAAAAR